MTPTDLSPSQRGRLRQLATLAYDRELSQELATLEKHFYRWHAGHISAGELATAIHEFHDGPNRKLWILYRESDLSPAIARALALRFLENHEVGADLLSALRKQVDFFRSSR